MYCNKYDFKEMQAPILQNIFKLYNNNIVLNLKIEKILSTKKPGRKGSSLSRISGHQLAGQKRENVQIHYVQFYR